MTFLRSSLFAVVTALVASCGGSQTPPTQEPPITRPPDPEPTVKVGGLDLSVASVSLADDCGGGPTGAPVAAELAQERKSNDGGDASITEEGQAAKMAAGDRACEQSTLQLRVANTSGAAAGITIKKVEVVDDSGAVVGELTPRAPSQWTGDTYAAWDEQVAPAQTIQASYALSAQPLGRGATYTVRITVASGDAQETVERKVTLEAFAEMPPDVVT
jgi:hypothetical protein